VVVRPRRSRVERRPEHPTPAREHPRRRAARTGSARRRPAAGSASPGRIAAAGAGRSTTARTTARPARATPAAPGACPGTAGRRDPGQPGVDGSGAASAPRACGDGFGVRPAGGGRRCDDPSGVAHGPALARLCTHGGARGGGARTTQSASSVRLGLNGRVGPGRWVGAGGSGPVGRGRWVGAGRFRPGAVLRGDRR
jgi:hypothetical protein